MGVTEFKTSNFLSWLTTFHEQLEQLRKFLDGLDSVAGADGDTGTNALVTVGAINQKALSLSGLELPQLLPVLAAEALASARGSIGLFLAHAFLALSQQKAEVWRPVELLETLLTACRCEEPLTTNSDGDGIAKVAADVSFALEDVPAEFDLLYVADTAAFAAQDSLVETGKGRLGVVDPGGAVLVVALSSLASVLSGDMGRVLVAGQMLVDLAADVPGRGDRPARDAEFEVSFTLRGSAEDTRNLRELYEKLRVNATIVGQMDMFGVGQWQVNARTGTPLATLPRDRRVQDVMIRHVRPAATGVDAGTSPAPPGVRLLEARPTEPVKLVETQLVALTRASGLVEELARSGAIVLFHPSENLTVLPRLIGAQSAPVAVIIPCDQDTAVMARHSALEIQTQTDLEGNRKTVRLANTADELQVLAWVRRWSESVRDTTSLEAALLQIEEVETQAARTRTRVVEDSHTDLVETVIDLLETGDESLQVLLGTGHGPTEVSLISSAVELKAEPVSDDPTLRQDIPLEVIQGGQAGALVLAAVSR